jgi:hypothetical protein
MVRGGGMLWFWTVKTLEGNDMEVEYAKSALQVFVVIYRLYEDTEGESSGALILCVIGTGRQEVGRGQLVAMGSHWSIAVVWGVFLLSTVMVVW